MLSKGIIQDTINIMDNIMVNAELKQYYTNA